MYAGAGVTGLGWKDKGEKRNEIVRTIRILSNTDVEMLFLFECRNEVGVQRVLNTLISDRASETHSILFLLHERIANPAVHVDGFKKSVWAGTTVLIYTLCGVVPKGIRRSRWVQTKDTGHTCEWLVNGKISSEKIIFQRMLKIFMIVYLELLTKPKH